MYVKVVNGVAESYTIGQLRKDNPNTSFPRNIPVETLASYNVFPAFDVPKPAVTDLQRVQQNGYTLDGLGNWTPVYEVVDMFSDYVDENGQTITKAEQETAYLTKKAEERLAQATQAIQEHLDNEAKTKRYDNIVSACSYAGYPNPYQAEGQAAIEWRGAVWSYATNVWAEVALGTRAEPTIEELINELPTITWPA